MSAAAERLLVEVMPVVRAIVQRKSGMSLAPGDGRPDNVAAIDLMQDVLARLWERLVSAPADTPGIRSFRGFAAGVTYNAWSDHLRERYPSAPA